MKTQHDTQWKRYTSKFGKLCIYRFNREIVSLIPAHTPHIGVKVERDDAAKGLRAWRAILLKEGGSNE